MVTTGGTSTRSLRVFQSRCQSLNRRGKSEITMHEEIQPDRHHELIYCTKLGLLYHRKRERFFDLLDKETKAITVVLGATLLGDFARNAVTAVGGIVSALALLALVFSYSDRKQRHKELAMAYADLRSKIENVGTAYTEDQLNSWHGEYHKLNGMEPPALGTLVVLCQNEIAVEEGQLDKVVKVHWYKQLFANWRDFPLAT